MVKEVPLKLKKQQQNTSISWREGRNISKSNSLVPSE